MDSKNYSVALLLLAGLFLTGCQKDSPPQKHVSQQTSSSIILSASSPAGTSETNIISRDLGELALTNHYETCVPLGAGKECLVTPKIIDSRNVQLTLAVESKSAKGKIHDLSITQVVTRSGKPFEVAVGEFSFSLTPIVSSE